MNFRREESGKLSDISSFLVVSFFGAKLHSRCFSRRLRKYKKHNVFLPVNIHLFFYLKNGLVSDDKQNIFI